ncbi:hypothetical protein K0M31_006075 [Melipona bicolor]|uniref:Uncharacterized protein n=1 Tax=Melipona bicolor TaxID=60889 RepID=A0AA40FTI3_9HYME|nr:hypothetical protein K0M31_006075 [Melipona bicolor]
MNDFSFLAPELQCGCSSFRRIATVNSRRKAASNSMRPSVSDPIGYSPVKIQPIRITEEITRSSSTNWWSNWGRFQVTETKIDKSDPSGCSSDFGLHVAKLGEVRGGGQGTKDETGGKTASERFSRRFTG